MNSYYEEIEKLIERNEISKKTRRILDNSETLKTYWNIGKLIFEAQGGEKRAKYGNELIKEWSIKFTNLYGSGYDASNLKRFRKFYLVFPKGGPLGHQLTWSHIRCLIPIKDENKRNYYVNLILQNNFSVRDLKDEIKSNAYERLVNKPKKIEIVPIKNEINIRDNLRNPIIIKLNKGQIINSEKDLQLQILAQFQSFFMQLGSGYSLIGNEYKITHEGRNYFIDILLFNYKLNLFVVVELKIRELRQTDKGEIQVYMNLVDRYVRETFHNKTVGIIISKEQDDFIVSYVSEENLIPITYKVESDGENICE